MSHLEKNILSGKKMSKKQLKKEAREELRENHEDPKEVEKEGEDELKGKKKDSIKGPKDNHEKKLSPGKRTTSNGYMVSRK